MKKIDFHIHTVQGSLDAPFLFCMEKLKEYVNSAHLDCIAITNHNLFNKSQFDEIADHIPIPVFPGIEIDLEGSQVLLIADGLELADFEQRCAVVSMACAESGSITVHKLFEIFPNMAKYIVIPHYDKKPAIRPDTLEKLKPHVTAGEVSSPKKFIYSLKDKDRLVPVYFSDSRIREELKLIPVRQTYLDCNEVNFSTIKHCLRDKNKVSLSEKDGNKLFQVFENGQKLSTGLNVIIGERSSGKSHTLDKIDQRFDNVRYIKQFALVARDEEDDKRRFNELLSQKHSLFSKDYLAELQQVVSDVLDVDLDADERSCARYLDALLKFAHETEKHDAFSKAVLFSEESFPVIDQKGLKELVDSTKNLLRNEEFRDVIDKHLPADRLRALYTELMQLYGRKEEERSKKIWINELIQNIQSRLRTKTAAPTIPDFDPYRILMNKRKVDKFNGIVKLARRPREILRKQKRGFEIIAEVGPFRGAGELKSLSKSQIAFSSAFSFYDDPYKYLQGLKELDSRIPAADYFRYLVKIDYKITNKDGFEASGGERSEFFLLQEIENARAYDMLLIDEPESSFDNLFLKNSVNEIIKDISSSMPVIIVTHNNTVGASIQPDFLLFTRKEVQGKSVDWRIYSGFPTSSELQSVDGRSLRTWEATMGCLEAGSEAYEERARGYEDLKN